MDADKEYSIHVLVKGDRSDFRLFSVFLWGDYHNFDSDGDSYNLASRTWTWLYMASREFEGQYVEIDAASELPLIFSVESPVLHIANRAAFFLALETNGFIIDESNNLLPFDTLTDSLGEDFDLLEDRVLKPITVTRITMFMVLIHTFLSNTLQVIK
jgi:hypothetical protein